MIEVEMATDAQVVFGSTVSWLAFIAGAFAVIFGSRSALPSTFCFMLGMGYVLWAGGMKQFYPDLLPWVFAAGPVRNGVVALLYLFGFLLLIRDGLRRRIGEARDRKSDRSDRSDRIDRRDRRAL